MVKSYFIHDTAEVDEPASIGEGTKIWHWSHISEGAVIGKNCIIGQNVFVGKNVKIGNNVKIQNNVSIYEAVELEDDVFCGPSVVFTNVKNPRAFIERKDQFKTTLVKKGVSIGANSTILCGVVLDEYSFIGAASFVDSSVSKNQILLGNPANLIGFCCNCLEKRIYLDRINNSTNFICDICGVDLNVFKSEID